VNAEPTIRLARDEDEAKVAHLLDEAFASPGRESRLWALLRAEYPDYDPGLAFVAESTEGALGGALLVHPRTLWIRGVEVPCGVLSPFAVAPHARGSAWGARLVTHALRTCAPRFDLVVLLGEPRYFARFGFAPAFGQSRVRARLAKELANQAGAGWRAIGGADLSACRELYERSYAGVSGTERRTLAALDWDSRAPRTHTLVLEREGRIAAYARFHIGTAISVAECGARLPRDGAALAGLLARLQSEHARETCEVLVPRAHPLVRTLLRAGGELTLHDMTGAVLAWSPAPRRLLARLLAGPQALERARARPWKDFTLELPDGVCSVRQKRGALHVEPASGATDGDLRLAPPRVPGWLTGMEPLREALAERDEGAALDSTAFSALEQLLPPSEAAWSWSPLYDVVGW
jgi:putative acetyltransferase